MDIAVIGISCRLPDANNYEMFWENLKDGRNCVRKADDRWNVQEYKRLAGEDFSNASVSSGIVPEIDKFDHQFFQISPKEAKHMDPQQRLLLEETWRCIEDAGIPLTDLQQKLTSVYVGAMGLDYYQNVHEEEEIDGYCATGVFPHLLSGRISYFFDLKGKSQTIDTACSSSLSALDNAVKELQAGHTNYSVVAGVNLNVNPSRNVMWLRNRMLSADGLCKSFDATADGFVSGDGVACILLQPYENAIREHNHIYGVIKGINVVHGGKAVSLTAPSADAQTRLICGTYDQVDFKADAVNYIETHGSGTSLGDPIEVESLTRSYRSMTDKKQFCYLGTVKSNIGHLEAASGIVALIKVLLMMKYHQIPPTLNVTKPNPIIDFKRSPFLLADELREWKAPKENEPRRAGVNSFGLAGVSVHVLLEEYIPKPLSIEEEDSQIFLLSAKTKKSMIALIETWKEFIETEAFERIQLSNICKTLSVGRVHFTYRTGTIVHSC